MAKASKPKASGSKASAAKAARAPASGRSRKADPAAALRQAALELAAEGRWRDLSLSEIAAHAGLSMAEAYRIYTSRQDILRALMRATDETVLAGTAGDLTDEPPRDRLFDLLMRRLDHLAPHKAAYATIVRDLARDPLAGACLLCSLRGSLAAMLEAVGISSTGLKGNLRIKGLGLLYLSTLRVWFRDESPDQAKTMAALDRDLTRIDRLLTRCRKTSFCRRSDPDAELDLASAES